ncbi:S-methyl-5-thioribose kinase [Providencia rettgeri]|uniref:S-methyl-5-thioribose kinase n=1 Tax=Providencia rettgeri TaxID=587 RepID=UPI0005B389B5|nr:S-methyl-5-thioribose kinase [Providencia rettgeri]EJD6538546.1 S-methyl-5-thioribose kinase [Providencia rettgeri]ELQ1455744.1 S-methyl-5-thioribose kinase [Providencia rettgeri]ELR5186158.1 S-methyl-5-thioribose kinase [Providencia rettgeri]EMB0749750.1 S-methyl-5-thioribose kinase [Providencia rettgeri]
MLDSIPAGYKPLTCETLPIYLASKLTSSCELGGEPNQWKVNEVGDGNLNMVFLVEGTQKTIVVKQALPWVRAGGESWPLSLTRAGFEYNILSQEARCAGHELVPEVYFYDQEMALFAMEYLSPHIILRKEVMAGKKFPKLAEDIGTFIAKTLFYTSDIGMKADQKKALTAQFALNHELCKITEDLIFTEPYFNAERNNWLSPELDQAVEKMWQDKEMIQVAMRYKYKFMTEAQSLLHGDLHLGSVMVTESDTKVIDPEFGFMGPMAFDIGNYIGNLLMAFFSRPAWDENPSSRVEYQNWLLDQVDSTWSVFVREFRQLWNTKTQGDAWPSELYQHELGRQALQEAQDQFFATLLEDSLVNAGMEMNRRIIGFAGVAEFKQIKDIALRAECEKRALTMARELIVNASLYKEMASVIQLAKKQ